MDSGLEASLILDRKIGNSYAETSRISKLYQNIIKYFNITTKNDIIKELDHKKNAQTRKEYLHEVLVSETKMTSKAQKFIGSSLKILDGINYDKLTRLYDRETIDKVLDCEIKTSEQTGGHDTITCLFIDIDNFKKINDTYNHSSGDYVLEEVSNVMRKCLRTDNDYIGRYGGDEFVVALPQLGMVEGYKVAERIQRKVNKIKLPFSNLQLNLSIGLANFKEDAITRKDLINAADQAMYMIKKGKKGNTDYDYGKDQSVGVFFGDPKKQFIPGNDLLLKKIIANETIQ